MTGGRIGCCSWLAVIPRRGNGWATAGHTKLDARAQREDLTASRMCASVRGTRANVNAFTGRPVGATMRNSDRPEPISLTSRSAHFRRLGGSAGAFPSSKSGSVTEASRWEHSPLSTPPPLPASALSVAVDHTHPRLYLLFHGHTQCFPIRHTPHPEPQDHLWEDPTSPLTLGFCPPLVTPVPLPDPRSLLLPPFPPKPKIIKPPDRPHISQTLLKFLSFCLKSGSLLFPSFVSSSPPWRLPPAAGRQAGTH